MATSGLSRMQRTWSGNARDLVDDGSSGVVPIKPRDGSQSRQVISLQDRILAEIKNTPNADFSEISARAEAEHARYKKEAMRDSPSRSFERDESWEQVIPSPPIITTSGTKRADDASISGEVQVTAGPSGKRIEARQPGSSEALAPLKKRQLPKSFGSNDGKEHGQSKWSKASELPTTSREKLQFVVKGSGDGSGHRSLEADRHVGKLFLSKEQQIVHELAVKQGKSIFFTGSAGTGKSVVLREIIRGLKKKHIHKNDAVAVTASTGIAACNIGGVTLHSFAGVGLATEPKEMLVSKVRKNRKAVSRWMRTQSLVIDEISMIDPDFLDKLEYVGRTIRKSVKPFGGIQVIMTGDFFQLPPVTKKGEAKRYAFDASCWDDIAQQKINLTQVFRQKDPEFVKMLNELRFGKLSPETIATFTSLTKKSELEATSEVQPTRLFPLRMDVEKANAEQMRDIGRAKKSFDAIDGGTLPVEQRNRILDNFMAPKLLHLKPGCQVMLIKNTEDYTLVNGSIGTVLTFLSPKDWNMAQYSGVDWESVDPSKQTEEELDEMIHTRYSSIEEAHMNTSRDEDMGKSVSVDSSPERKPRIEYLEAMEREAKKERSRSRSASPEKQIEPRKYPVVRFLVPNSRSRTVLCSPETWKNEQPDGEVVASRTQVPLILAWAMSIHKSQGQTLPLVKIDLGRIFEVGQAYVALSRAVSKEGLQVLNFNANKVLVDPRVSTWYKSLQTVR